MRPTSKWAKKPLVSIVALCSLILAACGSGAGASTASGSTKQTSAHATAKAVHLTWWVQWGGIYYKLIHTMTNVWNKSHPGIQVTVTSVPTNGAPKLLAAIAAGRPPDIYTENLPAIGEYASKGFIEPLNKYMTGKYVGAATSLYPVAAKWGTYKGKIYGYPISMNSWLLFYNKNLMKAAGLNPNNPPKTIAQLGADQAKEWKVSGSHIQQMGYYPSSFDHWAGAFGVHLYKNGKWNIANNANALREMKWIQSYDHYPAAEVSGFQSSLGSLSTSPFDTGKVGFYIQGPWQIPENKTNDPSMKWGVEPVPAPSGGNSGTTDVNGNYNIIPKGAKHQKQAWEFTAWFAGYKNTQFAAKYLPEGGWIPPSPRITKMAAYQKYINSTAGLSSFVTVFNNPKDFVAPVTCNEAVYDQYMGNAVQAVKTKKMGAKAALRYVQNELNKASCS